MLRIRTLERFLSQSTSRSHLGHYSTNDKNFTGEETTLDEIETNPENIELEKVKESDGNWHNNVKIMPSSE